MAQPSNPPDDTREGDARAEEMRAWMVRYGPALRRYFEKRVGRAEADGSRTARDGPPGPFA